ncbi:hypothetical protein [Streptomyces sp. NPDC002537]
MPTAIGTAPPVPVSYGRGVRGARHGATGALAATVVDTDGEEFPGRPA